MKQVILNEVKKDSYLRTVKWIPNKYVNHVLLIYTSFSIINFKENLNLKIWDFLKKNIWFLDQVQKNMPRLLPITFIGFFPLPLNSRCVWNGICLPFIQELYKEEQTCLTQTLVFVSAITLPTLLVLTYWLGFPLWNMFFSRTEASTARSTFPSR